MNAFGRAIAALGVGIVAVGHWFWQHQHHPFLSRGRLWGMNGAFELYAGIFLIGVGVHALASWYWNLSPPERPVPSSLRERQ
ncbi:hypothetical protein JQ615_02560 [Bradyrhizobium jicamae]|uniref:Uncharacterized protein n=1 Tax=Bradyrhizobium jicamae TaxID=280332 RepID=A0ABS5FBW0_9BRAD|nr:hypothetical protein [Bradyrhizobium jicamae]MBR0794264.1 hypothetical protein [Bradyrhizobium jicamae]MBR0935877.1 hypothetical protein [Bradyrhizobium jicamae]